MSRQLIRSIILEYAIPLVAMVLVKIIAAKIADSNDQKGIDGIGYALAVVIAMRALMIVIAVVFLVANPIRILVRYRHELAGLVPVIKRILSIVLIVIPLLVSIPVIFEVPISNFLYDRKYNSGKGAYKAVEENFRSPSDFRVELAARGLYYDDEADMLRNKMNSKFAGFTPGRFEEYYYAKATMMPIEKDTFYDTLNNKEILDPDDENSGYPAYIYNAVLVTDEDTGKLKYAPFARYDDAGWLNGNDYPFFTDHYVECKILYVDGDIYAVIGVSESYDISKNYDTFERPFYMILSEKENITTFIDGKYYPYGAIGNEGDKLVMHANTTEHPYSSYVPANYPVKVVDRLDIDAINKAAGELIVKGDKE